VLRTPGPAPLERASRSQERISETFLRGMERSSDFWGRCLSVQRREEEEEEEEEEGGGGG